MKAPNPVNLTVQAAAQADQAHTGPVQSQGQSPGLAALIDCDRAALTLLLENRPQDGGPFDAHWHARYLEGICELARKILLSDELAAPLRDIVDHLVTPGTTELPASAAAYPQHEVDFIHAYAAAEISYLVFSGVEEPSAAQLVAKQLILHNVPLPEGGGDPRGWMRLLKWRATLKQKRTPEVVHEQYQARFNTLKESHGT